ncbi:MAG: S8 family serine peptidase [Gammaproteobacteria bacterium]
MSRRAGILVLGLLVSALTTLVGHAAEPVRSAAALLDDLYATDPAAAERIVLVLHEGRGEAEVPGGARASQYRNRGTYAATTWNGRVSRKLARRHGLEYVADWWMSEVALNCAVLRVPAGRSVDEAITALRADDDITLVQPMGTFHTLGRSYSDPYFDLQAGAHYFDLAALHERATGRGVRIAVIDTGVATGHPDLVGQVKAQQNFASAVSPGFDDDIHGTAVAGLVVARPDNHEGIVGIAPEAELFAFKACWPQAAGGLAAQCNSFTLALAINAALRAGVDIINLSLTGPVDGVIERLLAAATERGVVVVAATAEDAADGPGFPASVPGVIAVASAGREATAGVARVVLAPGEEIVTTVPATSYGFLSGTSFAAAQVTGYIALLRELHPGVTGEALWTLLHAPPAVATTPAS